MKTGTIVLTSLILIGTLAEVRAGNELIGFDQVEKRLGSEGFRLLDVRPRGDYDKGHAPGAVWVDTKAAQAIAAKPGGFTDRVAWQAWVNSLGIGPGSEVLIFDGARQLESARLWWMLSYLGLEKVGLINGNFPLWAKQKRPISTEVSAVEPGKFSVNFRTDRLATRADVLSALKTGQAAIVDARSKPEYTGERKMSERGGHIPAACRIEWSDLVDPDGRFLEESALRTKLLELGLKPGEPVITHCQGGGRASVDAFAIGRLGHPTRNFYVGWSDWGNATDTPVVEGAEPGKKD